MADLTSRLRAGALANYREALAGPIGGRVTDEHVAARSPDGYCTHVYETEDGVWHLCHEYAKHAGYHQCVCGPASRRNGVGSGHGKYDPGCRVTCQPALATQADWKTDSCGLLNGGHRCSLADDHSRAHSCRCGEVKWYG